jgi:hypothetical protein
MFRASFYRSTNARTVAVFFMSLSCTHYYCDFHRVLEERRTPTYNCRL